MTIKTIFLIYLLSFSFFLPPFNNSLSINLSTNYLISYLNSEPLNRNLEMYKENEKLKENFINDLSNYQKIIFKYYFDNIYK